MWNVLEAMGDAMSISYAELSSYETVWTDGLHWLEDVRAWSISYEDAHMVAATTNNKLANAHLDLLFINLSAGLAAMAKGVVAVLLGERLRQAMM